MRGLGNPVPLFLVVELQNREMISRLLSGCLATAKNFPVFVGSARQVDTIALSGRRPFVYHDKSVNEDVVAGSKEEKKGRLARHRSLKSKGGVITAIDEEAGILHANWENFGRERFTERSLEQVDRFFCWGSRDLEWLSNRFPNLKNRFVKTGSARMDVLQLKQLVIARATPKPYILVSSNFGIPSHSLLQQIDRLTAQGIESRIPHGVRQWLQRYGERFSLLHEFLLLLEYLGAQAVDFEVVLRPHPTEDVRLWEALCKDFEGVKIDKTGSSEEWVGGADLVVHNGCSLGVEALAAGVRVVSYQPKNFGSSPEQSNLLGFKAQSPEQVLEIFDKDPVEGNRTKDWDSAGNPFRERVHLDDRLAASRFVEEWTALRRELRRGGSLAGLAMKMSLVGAWLKGKLGRIRPNTKIAGFDSSDVVKKVHQICGALQIETPRVRVINPHLIYLTPDSRKR